MLLGTEYLSVGGYEMVPLNIYSDIGKPVSGIHAIGGEFILGIATDKAHRISSEVVSPLIKISLTPWTGP